MKPVPGKRRSGMAAFAGVITNIDFNEAPPDAGGFSEGPSLLARQPVDFAGVNGN